MVPRKALPIFSLFAAVFVVPAIGLVDGASQTAYGQALAPAKTVSEKLKDKVQAFISPRSVPGARDALLAFYKARDFLPIWVDARGPTRAAVRVMKELRRAGDYGLNPKTFALKANGIDRGGGAWTPSQTAAAEFEISRLALTYASQARGGRINSPETLLSSYLDREPNLPDPNAVLAAVTGSATPGAVLRAYQPQQAEFKRLQAAYVKIRDADDDVKHVSVPLKGPLLVRGMRHPDVAILREQLGLSAEAKDANLYDKVVISAVKAFQKKAGLSADGMVGKRTRRALSPKSDKAHMARLLANMEAWRWMPADLGKEYLLVNIPAFSIELVRDGETVMTERVITGRSDKQTPVFSKKLSTIVLRPQWHLPNSIKIEKLLSARRRGRTLEAMGYVIKKGRRTVKSWRVNWAKADLRKYEISQPSGDGNALGDVKFLFPNKHSVYLHDTPSKSLFNASERTFSHGCIRLRNPLKVAQLLLDDDKGKGKFNVKRLVNRGPGSNKILLDRPMPIHVAYFTAWADADGHVSYYDDVYGHEKRVNLALAGKWKAIDKTEDHLAAADTSQLKAIQVIQGASGVRSAAADGFLAPMGVTKGPPSLFKPAKAYKYRRYSGGGVGEIMRRSLGGF